MSFSATPLDRVPPLRRRKDQASAVKPVTDALVVPILEKQRGAVPKASQPYALIAGSQKVDSRGEGISYFAETQKPAAQHTSNLEINSSCAEDTATEEKKQEGGPAQERCEDSGPSEPLGDALQPCESSEEQHHHSEGRLQSPTVSQVHISAQHDARQFGSLTVPSSTASAPGARLPFASVAASTPRTPRTAAPPSPRLLELAIPKANRCPESKERVRSRSASRVAPASTSQLQAASGGASSSRGMPRCKHKPTAPSGTTAGSREPVADPSKPGEPTVETHELLAQRPLDHEDLATSKSEYIAHLLCELSKLRDQIVDCKLEYEKARERTSQLEAENGELKCHQHEANIRVAEMQRREHELERDRSLCHGRWEDGQKQMEEHWKRFDSLQERWEASEERRARAEARAEAAEARAAAAEARASVAEARAVAAESRAGAGKLSNGAADSAQSSGARLGTDAPGQQSPVLEGQDHADPDALLEQAMQDDTYEEPIEQPINSGGPLPVAKSKAEDDASAASQPIPCKQSVWPQSPFSAAAAAKSSAASRTSTTQPTAPKASSSKSWDAAMGQTAPAVVQTASTGALSPGFPKRLPIRYLSGPLVQVRSQAPQVVASGKPLLSGATGKMVSVTASWNPAVSDASMSVQSPSLPPASQELCTSSHLVPAPAAERSQMVSSQVAAAKAATPRAVSVGRPTTVSVVTASAGAAASTVAPASPKRRACNS